MQQDIYMPRSAVSERKALQSHQQEHSVPHPPVTPRLQLCFPMSRERMFTVQSSSTRPGDTDDTPRCNFGLLYSQRPPRLISTTLSTTEETCSVEVLSKVMQVSLLNYNFHMGIYALSWMVNLPTQNKLWYDLIQEFNRFLKNHCCSP